MFGIEIDNALLMETGLNVVGFLAAGGLSVLLYSSMTKRRWRRMFAEIIEQSAQIVSADSARAIENAAEPQSGEATRESGEHYVSQDAELTAGALNSRSAEEFVSFGSPEVVPSENEKVVLAGSTRVRVDSAVTQYRQAHNPELNSVANGRMLSGVYTRNRSDVIRLAKEMLASGRTSDTVRNELPISESEMRLVELGAQRAISVS